MSGLDLLAREGNIMRMIQSTSETLFLIHSVEDLMRLADPEIGCQGHHFCQMADVDISAVENWQPFDFLGHYDGNGFTLIGQPNIAEEYCYHEDVSPLFHTVHRSSYIHNVTIKNSPLAHVMLGGAVAHCISETILIAERAENTTFLHCTTQDVLVGRINQDYEMLEGALIGCTVTYCRAWSMTAQATDCRFQFCQTSGGPLIGGWADHSQIADCESVLDFHYDEAIGGISSRLKNSTVTRCIISGRALGGLSELTGIAFECDCSTISFCAVGPVSCWEPRFFYGRVSYQLKNRGCLIHNVSIEGNAIYRNRSEDLYGVEGKTLPVEQFNQAYFEQVLHWDFATVWRWDSASCLPVLQMMHKTN